MEVGVPQTWTELRQLVLETSDRADVELTSHYGVRMIAVAEETGAFDVLASAWFTWGVALDNIGEVEGAERAFLKALEYDEAFHGPHHVALADARRSLGMVQQRGEKYGLAAANFAEASRLYAELNPVLVADVEIRRGAALLVLLELEEAKKAFENALLYADQFSGPGSDPALLALNNLGVVHRQLNDYESAFWAHSEVTRRARSGTRASRFQHIAKAWLHLARLSRWVLQSFPQAWITYGFAAYLGEDKIKEIAESEVAEIHGSHPTGLSADVWLLTHYDTSRGVGHVAHPLQGLWVFCGASPGLPGQQVDVQFTDGNVVVSPRLRPTPV